MNKLVNDFSIDNLLNFFKTKVSSFKPLKENLNQILSDNHFEQFTELTKLGEIDFKGVEDLLVFACKSNTALTERSSKKRQFEIAKKVLKEDFKDGAIFVFYDVTGNFRFSFLRKNYGNKEQKFTTWKRYTYYVEKDKTNKTFKDRVGNADFSSLDTLQKAFSVEKLTEDFYKELFAWYQWTLSEQIGVTFPNNTETGEDDRIKLEEQIIRLITRLLFVWFIKQKKLVPDNLFDTENLKSYLKDFDANSKTEGNYYNAILQNLFFATLNKEIKGRRFAKIVGERDIKTLYRYAEMFNISEDEVLALFNQVPFLNGGLFECLDKEKSFDGIKYALDGFSRNATKSANGNFKHRAFIPNSIFFDDNKGIIPLLERYNFTVEENAPNEIQVALDPELLGNVFENLLGAFNPETKETARKQSGSFYTPREIVSYMVDESLIFYLLNAFPHLQEESIRELFTAEELPSNFAENHQLCEEVSLKLKEIKLLDPACGSGAFPMGILNRMVEVLEKLACHQEKSVYDLKLHLIEECIYGVDIQTIAVQISKLRFFISLIVEEDNIDLTKKEENYGILTLPNLETKFVSANTLIGLASANKNMLNLNDKALEAMKTQLWEVRKQHFYAKSANEKKRLRIADEKLRDEIKDYISANASRPNATFIKQLEAEITQLEKKRKNFEGELWVDDTTKHTQVSMFDSGARNPSIFKIDKNLAERKKIDTAIKALQAEIAKEQNKALNVGFEKEIETIAKWNPYDQNTSSPFFDVEWMFGLKNESADSGSFDVVIGNPPYVQIKNITSEQKLEFVKRFKFATGRFNLFYFFIEVTSQLTKKTGYTSFIVPDRLLLNTQCKMLRSYLLYDQNIKELVTFGEFVFKSAIVDSLIISYTNEKNKNREIRTLKNCSVFGLRSKERIIVPYSHIESSPNNQLDLNYNKDVSNLVSKIRNGAKLYGEICDVRDGIIQSKIPDKLFLKERINDNSKKLLFGKDVEAYKILWDNNWVNYNIDEMKLEESLRGGNGLRMRNASIFEKPKILTRQTSDSIIAGYDTEHHYYSNTLHGAIIVDKSFDALYVLGVLNSKLMTFYYRTITAEEGKVFAQVKIELLNLLPIKICNNQDQIISHVAKIQNDQESEKRLGILDTLVYKLYDLTHEEVLIIDPEFSLSQSEYDNLKIEANG